MTRPSQTPAQEQSAGSPRTRRGITRRAVLATALAAGIAGLTGCAGGPRLLDPADRVVIDRAAVEVPTGFDLEPYAVGLNAPVAMTFDSDGNLIIAESGTDAEPRIYGFTPNHKRFDVYPLDKPLLPFTPWKFRLYGPIGDVLFHKGWLYVSHRDENGLGSITALDYQGGHRAVIAGLPARGEHGITDMAIDPKSGRLYFGVGSATNSGVVGLDDFAMGWPKRYPDAHDIPYTPDTDYTLWGRRMNSSNPAAMWLMPDIAVTGPFQPFGSSNKTRIKGATAQNPKCNSAIISCQPDGGDPRVEVHGVRLPRGLTFDSYGYLYFTNQGMEARGTRPVNDDPDSFCRSYPGTWYGFPDYTTHVHPVTQREFQPPIDLIINSGYPDLSFLINHQASGLGINLADPKTVVYGVFSSQSGASGFDFVPSTGPFKEYAGSAIVALFGDRSPFATGGQQLNAPVGFKVVRVDVDRRQVRDFIKNVQPGPSSNHGGSIKQLERPVDVKFGPDGALYILDFGKARMKKGILDATSGTGRIYRLLPSGSRTPAASGNP